MYSTWTFPSSNGAERNGFDNNGYTTWTTCNFFPSYLFFPRSAPLCATMIGTALEHLFLPRSAEQSGTVMTMMGQCSGALSVTVARSGTGKDVQGNVCQCSGALSVTVARSGTGKDVQGNVCQCSGALSVTVARSGTERGKDEMPKERKQFLSQFFPRSAPLRATMIGTALEDLFLPWSHGAEQNSDVNVLGRYTSLYHRAERSGEKCPGNIGQRNCHNFIPQMSISDPFRLCIYISLSLETDNNF
jgi:hypothetical protein